MGLGSGRVPGGQEHKVQDSMQHSKVPNISVCSFFTIFHITHRPSTPNALRAPNIGPNTPVSPRITTKA